MNFSFDNLSDLVFSPQEINVIQKLFAKSSVNTEAWQCTAQQFFENFIRCAKVAIPCNAVPSCVWAQGILESGWFKTGIVFGVKATKEQQKLGEGQVDNTDEVVNGEIIKTQGAFFNGTIQQQFANYYAYLGRRKPATAQFLTSDSIGYVGYLQDATVLASDGTASDSYSTAGQLYSDSILSVIRDNNLSVFDHA